MRQMGVSAVLLTFIAFACGDEQGIRSAGTSSAGTSSTSSASSTGGSSTNSLGSSSGGSGSTGGGPSSAGNTASAGNAGSSASGGSSASAGSSATGGNLSGGGGATGGTSDTPITRVRKDLVAFEGHVYRITNDFEIEGDWNKVSSSANTVLIDVSGTKACVSGTAKKLENKQGTSEPDWDKYWGAVVTLSLNNEGPGATARPYNAVANGFAGIEATLEGSQIPEVLLMKFKEFGKTDNFCIKLASAKSGSRQRLLTKEARANCDSTPGATVDPQMLENLEFHVLPNANKDVQFDFCVKDVKVVPIGAEAGG